MSEGVIKSGHREPFTVLYKSAIRDTRLSFEMLGFLTYMLDKPPDWEFTISGMAKERGIGKDTVRRLVGRLEEVGYLKTPMCCRKNHRCLKIPTTVKTVVGKLRQRIFRPKLRT